MLMAEQVILTVFVISITFRAETEGKLRIGLLGSSANRALMSGNIRSRLYLPLKFLLPVNFLWRNTPIISRAEKENQEIQHGNHNQNTHNCEAIEKIIYKGAYQ